jgi:hypothetical protein
MKKPMTRSEAIKRQSLEMAKKIALEEGGKAVAEAGLDAAGAAEAVPYVGPAVSTYHFLNNLWKGGAEDIMRGKGDKGTYVDTYINANPMFAMANQVLKPLGFGSVGNVISPQKKTAVEGDRLKFLQDKGIMIAGLGEGEEPQDETRSRQEQYEDMLEEGKTPAGDSKWLETGDVSQSSPEDWWGYASWYAADPTWISGHSEGYRKNLVSDAIEAGAINEHHGTIDVDFDKLASHMQEKYKGEQPEWWEDQNPDLIPEGLRPEVEVETPVEEAGAATKGPEMAGYEDLSEEEKNRLWGTLRGAVSRI